MAYQYLFKYIVIGDSSVGKSCLLMQFTDGRFKDDHEVTIGAEFGGKIITLNGTTLYLQIWDTAGQENYRSITRSYYRGAAIALIVYDISRRESFLSIKQWISEVHEHGNFGTLIVLVGNKSDLGQQRKVTTEEGQELAKRHKIMFVETSAKDDVNVKELFEMPASALVQQIQSGKIDVNSFGHGIKVGAGVSKTEIKKKKCC